MNQILNTLSLFLRLAIAYACLTLPTSAQVIYAGRANETSPSTVPANSIGVESSYYFDLLSGNVYGPKTLGIWPTFPLGTIILQNTVLGASGELLVVGPGGHGIISSGLKPLTNYTDTVPPSSINDSTQGFGTGSFGVVSNTLYVCTDATPNAAVWIAVASVALATYTGIIPPPVTADAPHGFSVGSPGINTTTGQTYFGRSMDANSAVWVWPAARPVTNPIAGVWRGASGQGKGTNSIAIGSTTLMVATPFFISNPESYSAVGTKIVTAGTSTFQISIYASSPTTNWATGLPLHTTIDIADTSTGVINTPLVPTWVFSQPGMYWEIVEVNDTTAAFLGPNGSLISDYVGNGASQGNLHVAGSDCATYTTSAYGTWPDLTAITPTFPPGTSQCAVLDIKTGSVP